MTDSYQLPQFIENYDFKEIKQQFLDLNKKRISRIHADLRQSQLDFLKLLPLFFHVNHPMLPGYVSKETPVGIPGYQLDKETERLAMQISRSFDHKKKAYRRYDIDAIYLMGSSGTIAYNDKSDFDIWICHSEELDEKAVAELEVKVAGVQQWAEKKRVEANLYLVNPAKLRRGEYQALSNESSGSALSNLLLEEFYRTGVLLHGRYPLWWLVPPEIEHKYDEYVEELKKRRYLHSREHVDFGGLRELDANEFYGATLWMLYKGINSPYKSILKILLMQAYASEFPQAELLGLKFKQAIYNGESELDQLDPYILMLQKVEDYLKNAGDEARLRLARRSFYFKVDEQMSLLSQEDKLNWRQALLTKLLNKWGWRKADIVMLDQRNNWKIQQVIKERNALITEFKLSYRFLSNFVHQQVKSNNLIRQTDLNILGRKIYAAFERKAGKVELVYRGIADELYESHISIHKLVSEKGKEFWIAFSGVVSREDVPTTAPLKRSVSIVELLAWCHFNKIVNKNTKIGLYSTESDLSEKELDMLVQDMGVRFQEEILDNADNEDYRQAATIIANATYINVGVDPLVINRSDGKHIASEQSDALKYGSGYNNLAISIDQVMLTSWNEVLNFSYRGISGLMDCLKEYMQWAPPSQGRRPPSINASSFSSYRGTSISRRIEELFNSIYECFYSNRYASISRFILGVEKEFYIISISGDNLQYKKASSLNSLINYLSLPAETYSQYIFDNETLNKHLLPVIYEENTPGVVQCFYEMTKTGADVFVLDEKGTLSYHGNVFYDVSTLIRHFSRFFESVHNRMHFVAQQNSQQAAIRVDEVKFYLVKKDHGGQRSLVEQGINQYIRTTQYYSLQVIVDLIDNEAVYTLFYENEEFSSLQYGNDLYRKVAERVLRSRESKERYDIYVTDIDLSPAILSNYDNSLQTSRYLYYKNEIEKKLKFAMQATG